MKITGILKGSILGLVLVGSAFLSTDVRASLTPSFVPPVAGSGPFTFTYSVFLSSDQKVNGGAVPTASVITTTGTPGTNFASFFTIYDFQGFNGTHTEPLGWSFLSLATGATPSTTTPFDLAGTSNLTWYWTDGAGATLPTPGSIVGNFTAQTTVGSTPILHDFTSGATKNTPTDPLTNNTAIGTIGTVVAPGPNAQTGTVPEPTTLLLLGSGLAGLAGWRKWSAKKG